MVTVLVLIRSVDLDLGKPPKSKKKSHSDVDLKRLESDIAENLNGIGELE